MPITYQEVLADLRMQRERVDVAISVIEALAADERRETKLTSSIKDKYRDCINFGGMSLADASLTVLKSEGRSLRTSEILSALQEGGLARHGKNPRNTLGAVLSKTLARGGGLVRVKRGVWSLACWPNVDGLPGESSLPADRSDADCRPTVLAALNQNGTKLFTGRRSDEDVEQLEPNLSKHVRASYRLVQR
jgi:hypothetical protein